MILFYALIFFFGASLGSFYHVVGYRMPQNLNWVSDRSHCPHCQTQLKSYELLPIISYVIQRGMCRTCGTHIKFIYVLSEIVAGLLFLLPVLHYGLGGFESGAIYIAWAFASLLIIVSVSDIYYCLIQNKVLLFWSLVLVTLYVLYPNYNVMSGLVGALTGFLTLYAVDKLSSLILKKETIGGGDIKLFGVVGFVLGVHSVLSAICFSSMLALVYVLLAKPKNELKAIQFAPFIAVASYICLFVIK